MVSTARMARSRTPNFRCGTSRKSYRKTENALFTGPFYYTNPCIKKVVLIDSTWHRGYILVDMYDYFVGDCKVKVCEKIRTGGRQYG